jgi:hypothetical protein
MALFPFIRQFSLVDPVWFAAQTYPHLKLWLDFWITSAVFDQVMQEYPLWVSGNEPTVVVF